MKSLFTQLGILGLLFPTIAIAVPPYSGNPAKTRNISPKAPHNLELTDNALACVVPIGCSVLPSVTQCKSNPQSSCCNLPSHCFPTPTPTPTPTPSHQPQKSMGDYMYDLTIEEITRFNLGKIEFHRSFTEGEGFGPRFNGSRFEANCASCHGEPRLGGVHNGLSFNVQRFGFTDEQGDFDPLTEQGGSLLQSSSIEPREVCAEQVPAIANTFADRRPTSMFGAGLVEALLDSQLTENAGDNGSGISGRVHWAPVLEAEIPEQKAGRFGWKSQLATIKSFVADAALNEMGITNAVLPEEDPLCDTVADPEDPPSESPEDFSFVGLVTDFLRYLAPPPQTPLSGTSGEQIFIQIGCADCHLPSFTIPEEAGEPFGGKQIKPYSDFLLHDMGEMGDGIGQGEAEPREMRTAPLWGIARRAMFGHDGANGLNFEFYDCFGHYEGGDPMEPHEPIDDICNDPYSHFVDDMEPFIGPVVLNHGAFESEARPSAIQYFALSEDDRRSVIRFLQSLGRSEFDLHESDVSHSNNLVMKEDWFEFLACAQAQTSYSPDAHCAIGDTNRDSLVNATDLEFFIQRYVHGSQDCNCNEIPDAAEIFTSGGDSDNDGILDSCSVAGQFSLPAYVGSTILPGLETEIQLLGARPNSLLSVYYSVSSGNSLIHEEELCFNLSAPTLLQSYNIGASGNLWSSITLPEAHGDVYFQGVVTDPDGTNPMVTEVFRLKL